MGKIRVKTLGDDQEERKQKERIKARREGKKAQKAHVKGVGLKGGQQVAVMEGTELKPEVKELLTQTPEGIVKEKNTRKIKIRARSKRYKAALGLIDKKTYYDINKSIELLKKTSLTRFDGTVEAHFNLNPELFTKDKKSLSGSVTLPHGTGKKRRIVIADENIIDNISKGKIEFDVLLAVPSLMPKLAKVAKILGPRGLMPNPKNGTVTQDPEKRVQELEGGKMTWKTEPEQPVIHQAIGKVSFTDQQLVENIKTLLASINKSKIVKLTLSSTMGPGIKVDINSV